MRFGKPRIRGHRITVQEILEKLSGGASPEQILADYPQLEPEDFQAVHAYAAEEWPAEEIKAGIAELDSGHTIDHKDISRWLRSWRKSEKPATP